MQEKNKKYRNSKILFSLGIFIVSFFVFLILWVNIEEYYGKFVLTSASHITAKVKNVDFEGIKEKGSRQSVAQFFLSRKGKGFRGVIDFNFSLFTINEPLTFAIMAALFLFLTKHVRAYVEASAILFTIHFLYAFTYESWRITDLLAQTGLESTSEFGQFIWLYAWRFIGVMFIRFEPFLIGLYLYLRFSPSSFLRKK